MRRRAGIEEKDPGRDVRRLLSQRHTRRPHAHDRPMNRIHAPGTMGGTFVHGHQDAPAPLSIPLSHARGRAEDPAVQHLSDEELLELTPRAPAAFEQIYIRHERLIRASLRRRPHPADLAVALTAETCVAPPAAARRFKRGETPAI